MIEVWVKTGGYEYNEPKGEWVQKVAEEFGSSTQILLNPECDEILTQLNPIFQKRVGMVGLGIAINEHYRTLRYWHSETNTTPRSSNSELRGVIIKLQAVSS